MRPRRVLPALALTGAVLLTGCGGEDGDGAFDDAVAEVRAAVADGDAERANTALDGLALHALAAHDDGTIDDAELTEVAGLIESSKALVDDVVPAEATTTTTTTTVVTFEAEDDDDDEKDEDDDDEKDDGRGKGKKDD